MHCQRHQIDRRRRAGDMGQRRIFSFADRTRLSANIHGRDRTVRFGWEENVAKFGPLTPHDNRSYSIQWRRWESDRMDYELQKRSSRKQLDIYYYLDLITYTPTIFYVLFLYRIATSIRSNNAILILLLSFSVGSFFLFYRHGCINQRLLQGWLRRLIFHFQVPYHLFLYTLWERIIRIRQVLEIIK